MREIAWSIKTTKFLMGEPTAHLPTITHCYLLMPLLNIGPVAVVLAIGMAKLMSEATALLMGKSVANADVLIISKPFLILKVEPKEW